MLGLAAPYGKDHLGHEVCIFFFCFPCFVLFGGGQGFNHYVLIHRELLHRELKRIIKESFQKVHPILIRIH